MATHISRHFNASGLKIDAVWSRSAGRTEKLADELGCEWSIDPARLPERHGDRVPPPDGLRHGLEALGLARSEERYRALIDAALLWRHGWSHWELFSFLHLAWAGGFTVATVLNVGFLETVDGRQLRQPLQFAVGLV